MGTCKETTIQLVIDGIVVFEQIIDCGCEEEKERLGEYTHLFLSNFIHDELKEYMHG